MISLKDKVISTIKKFNMLNPGDRIVVGLSGGADSCVLTYILSKICISHGITVVAAHLNHGIRGQEADRDMEFSKAFASSLGIEIVCKKVSVPQYAKEHKLSEEMAARTLRYEFFDEVCAQYNLNKVAVAHNKNDSVETILLNLIRGSGSKGFEGIKAVNGNIIRPLIDIDRKDIEDYAKSKDIGYITDSTNLQDVYARNILRNNILPKMTEINSGAIDNIIRCSEILGKDADFFETEISKLDLFEIKENQVVIDRTKFDKLHPALTSRCVFKAIFYLLGNTVNISSNQIEQFCLNIRTGNVFAFGNGAKAYVTSQSLIFTNEICNIDDYEYNITIPGKLFVNETASTYNFEFVDNYSFKPDSVCVSADNIERLTLRTKRDSDVFKPYGMNGTKKIKSFFIDCKIPANDRKKYPLLVSNDEIVAVIPLRISDDYKVTKGTKKILQITKIGGTYDKL